MKLTINNKVVPVEIMDTPEKISRGMMGSTTGHLHRAPINFITFGGGASACII